LAEAHPLSLARRKLLHGAALTGALTLAAPHLNLGRSSVFAADSRQYSTRAIDLVGGSVVIDMLAPLSINDAVAMGRATGVARLNASQVAELRASGINVFHQSVGILGHTAYEDALSYMASYNGLIARTSDHLARIDLAGDIEKTKAAGKAGVILGLQNAEHFRTVEDVNRFHGLGLRCAQLTYNTQNRLGSGSTERVDGGVSDFGSEVIRRMNDVGMLADVSHSGDRTTLDAIELSAKPIAITHSNCRALFPHPRLKTDEAIRKLAARGGVMGITGVRMFVRDRDPTTLEHIVDHIDHVVKIAGIEHVGVGSDADLHGYDDLPPEQLQVLRGLYKASYGFREKIDIDGFDHPRKMFDLTEALIRRRYSDAHIRAILGGNFRRLLAQVWGG
jgi:membrane dipeptidase